MGQGGKQNQALENYAQFHYWYCPTISGVISQEFYNWEAGLDSEISWKQGYTGNFSRGREGAKLMYANARRGERDVFWYHTSAFTNIQGGWCMLLRK